MLHGVFVPMDHGNERPCKLGFTWCNPNYISILFLTKIGHQSESKKGLADFMKCRILSSYSKCIWCCVNHLRCHTWGTRHSSFMKTCTNRRYVILTCVIQSFVCQNRTIPWKVDICMYNRENIDPRYLGLHVHLGVLDCSKPNSGIRAQACFLVVLA